MKGAVQILTLLMLGVLLPGCTNDDGPKLPSVEDRISEAVTDLTNDLIEPADGWRLDYRPTSQTGSFLILLDFDEDGTVRVQSDVTANGGEFRDQILGYRIDSSQGIELIFETYGVFHYLFELQQASFGGEFEFVFQEEEGGNLIFTSKTDASSDVTSIVFQRATGSDSDLISSNAPATIGQGNFQTDNLGGIGDFGIFNFYLQDFDYLMSATFDMQRRSLKILGIAEGQDLNEVMASNNAADIGVQTTFSMSNDKIILDEPINASLSGNSFNISEIPVLNPSTTVDSFCDGQQDSVINFTATDAQLGNFQASSSLFQVANAFKPTDDVYSINYIFIYDDMDQSIADQIESVFPGVVAFQWYHGINIADSVFNGIGFVTVDEFNNAEFFLRGYDYTQNGNYLQLSFNGNNLITDDDATQEQLSGLDQLTDQIFSGNEVYMIELLNIDGLFEFYNPCNRYKGFLF